MPMSNDENAPVQDFSGRQFGNYMLLRPIGEGGYVHVYLGYDVRTPGRKVAVAIGIVSHSLEHQEHLRREAEILSELTHSHIVRTFDYDIEGNILYLVMEYCEKGNLYNLYPSGKPASVHTIVPHIKQIASALQYAHNRGVIHRDVKPTNILVNKEGNILLGDFGLAKQAASISRDGTAIGTSAYMAPEQWEGDAYSSSDQYALAVVVYELLCGELPFQGSTAEMAGQHKVKPLPASQLQKLDVPREVEKVLRRAMNKRPEKRYRSVMDFANEIEKAARSSRRTSQKFKDERRFWLLRGGAVATAVVVAWLGWDMLSSDGQKKSPKSILPAPVAPKQHQTIYTFRQHNAELQSVAWSPDGKHIASADAQGVIFVWNMHEAKMVRHDHQSKVLSLSWSPDSKYLASVSQDGVLDIWDATTGDIARTYTQTGISVAVWSAMADLAVGIGRTAQVYDIPLQRGFTPTNVDNVFAGHGSTVNTLAFSPTSSKVASGSDDYTVCVWDAETAHLTSRAYTGHKDEVLSVSWSPQLDLIASAGADHSVQIWNASTCLLFDRYQHGDSEHGYMPVKAVAWSSDGETLVSGGDDNLAKVWKIDRSISTYNGHSASVNAVAVSPDATYAVSGGDDKLVHVWKL